MNDAAQSLKESEAYKIIEDLQTDGKIRSD